MNFGLRGGRGVGRAVVLVLLVGVPAAGLPGCSSTARPPPEDVLAGMQTRSVDGGDFVRIEAHRPGAGHFAAVKPDGWNGKLLLWLHGGAAASDVQPTWCFGAERFQERVVRDAGFGLACASFVGGEHGFWPFRQDRDTRIARALFVRHFGAPDAVYLAGESAGAFGALKLIESGEDDYAGFLSICGGLGGVHSVLRLLLDVRELFEHFYPDVLPGHTWDTPTLDWAEEVVPRATRAMKARPEGARQLARVDRVQLPAADGDEVRRAVLAHLRFSVAPLSGRDFRGTATEAFRAELGGIPVGNQGVRYRGTSDDRALNRGIRRFAADSAAARRAADMYEPRGILERNGRRTRVLALHTTRDPLVIPRTSVRRYEAKLAGHGDAHLFEARLVDRFGHCSLRPDEILTAFRDLVAWVETGRRP